MFIIVFIELIIVSCIDKWQSIVQSLSDSGKVCVQRISHILIVSEVIYLFDVILPRLIWP